MSDDLHGRQLALLLLFFGTVGGGLYFLGWLTRPSTLYDAPLLCFAIAGGACFPARFLAELFDWWKRLAEPTRWTQARRERARERERAEAREAAARRRAAEADGVELAGGRHSRQRRFDWFTLVRRVVGVPLVLGSLAIIPLGISSGLSDERLARSGQVRPAVVLSVTEDKWTRSREVTITIARPGDGVPVELTGGDDLDTVPAVGDQVDVIVDPDDPSYVIAADVDWDMHWYWYIVPVVIGLICAGFSSMLLL
ncbi:hypothetical protein OHA18_23630 [Kribbella sp. NBC_00709]|uniref:DUF3592 domain-containing protein n=1 Tax=Kribbella sp. NBC_00709 TaxID=2975972 RepID=UPI002E29E4CA|nr:hypothetical protein [Kribbella sp. NBC_00709]